MNIAAAVLWLKFVDGIQLTRWDVPGATIIGFGIYRTSTGIEVDDALEISEQAAI